MTLENKQLLFDISEPLSDFDLENIYRTPVEFKGFNPTGLHVTLIDQDDVSTLLPDYDYQVKQQNYKVFDAVCIFDGKEPVFAFVRGELFGEGFDVYQPRKLTRLPLVSIVNISPSPEKVILDSSQIKPLGNSEGSYWPGYDLVEHDKMFVNKTETGYEIRFSKEPRGAF